MNDSLTSVLLALPVATAGVMVSLAAGMLRTERPMVRWTGVAFMLSVCAYAVKLWDDQVHVLPDALLIVRMIMGTGAVGLFWLFVAAVFDDKPKLHPWMLAAVAALVVVDFIGNFPGAPSNLWPAVLANLMRIAMALAALAIIVRGWKGDLVEPRRALRGPLLAIISAYMVATRSLAILDELGMAPGWYLVTNAAILFLIASVASFVFLESRGELFDAAPVRADVRAPSRRAVPDTHCRDRAMQADLTRVQSVMETQEVWREEGLTIASLSVRVNVPEAHLRRLINDQLGYRNFPSFVNAHRIAAAKARLSNPEEARVAVSSIAFDLGFGSLGPFNRAFKEETGVSPSEWRRNALNQTDEPENA
ncbi:MAG TPA: AraC family transcriptional regulator [Hyphomonadaceae bacterium]|jgi:AraC-like DNA-binding protein|nr:AraC family transcriptional regulator [Hyphomonadaceae bacterium]